jgi:hypothetical protein
VRPDAKVTFFNAAGEPTPNGEGVYGYKVERDGAGRTTQLLNLGCDGNPLPGAYHFVFHDFPGGSLEVLRDGQRVRVEGFEAGSVGFFLEDRAGASP